MEVHAHTHSSDPDSHLGRKKWTHYFWEFLMLFLAVFCGFMAENQREHMIENQREKKYIRSLYEDLRRDSVELVDEIEYRVGLSRSARYLITVLDTINKIKCTDSVYIAAYHLTGNPTFEYSNSTIEQLRSSGLLRIIRKKGVADSIVMYDIRVNRHFEREEAEKEIRIEYRKAITEILDGKYLVLFGDMEENNSSYQPINLPFLSTSFEKLNRIKSIAGQLYNWNGIMIHLLEGLLKRCNKLAELLRKEYHLK